MNSREGQNLLFLTKGYSMKYFGRAKSAFLITLFFCLQSGLNAFQPEAQSARKTQISAKNLTFTTAPCTITTESFNVNVKSTEGFPASGNLIALTNRGAARLVYTGITGDAFTGVTSPSIGQQIASGASVILVQRPSR